MVDPRPTQHDVVDRVVHLQAPRRVADPHPQRRSVVPFGRLEVDRQRGWGRRHPAHLRGPVRGGREVHLRQRRRVRAHACAPHAAQPQLETVGVGLFEGRVVGAESDEVAAVIDAEQECAARGVHEGGHRLGHDLLHGLVALVRAQVPARRGLELQAVGLAHLGDLRDRQQCGMVLDARQHRGGCHQHHDRHAAGGRQHLEREQVALVEDPPRQQQPQPQADKRDERGRRTRHGDSPAQQEPRQPPHEEGQQEQQRLGDDPPDEDGVGRVGDGDGLDALHVRQVLFVSVPRGAGTGWAGAECESGCGWCRCWTGPDVGVRRRRAVPLHDCARPGVARL